LGGSTHSARHADKASGLRVAIPAAKSSVQYGALPWRRSPDGIEFLLITTRSSGRWIVPKGWPEDHLAPHECAALEAAEEAGVIGEVATESLGSFPYRKKSKSGQTLLLRVELFAMEVTHQRRTWLEQQARQTQWCPLARALALVSDPGLRDLIVKFTREKQLARV
jgi:8-oxo-dGTP pyrophosphatase MutT (NUDIX family)